MKHKSMKLKSTISSTLKLLSLVLISTQFAHAGELQITVDSTSDQPQAGLTTLREAIETANSSVDAFIVFDDTVFSMPQTITLENGEMAITAAMIIDGPGADLLTIDANNLSRIFDLNDGTNDDIQVEISGLTLMNGNTGGAGGCISSTEILKLRSSVIKNCTAGANGGGMRGSNARGLLVENSSFLDNFSDNDGGGIFYQNGGGNLIINSTFSGNIASRNGGGLAVIQIGSLDFINNTVSGNQAIRGAGIFSNRPLNVLNSTIVNNTGPGVELAQDAIQNNIIAGNSDLDCIFTETGINNQNNLDADGSCGEGAMNHTTVADPLLGPLADNGGFTLTHLPLDGSPVIDAGDDGFCDSTDQRGALRPADGDGDGTATCDIGAVEVGGISDLIFKDGFDE